MKKYIWALALVIGAGVSSVGAYAGACENCDKVPSYTKCMDVCNKSKTCGESECNGWKRACQSRNVHNPDCNNKK
jgi:hypothetical protein